jgi:protocatechuate 3,4-dioxygenase, alpha subunit
MPGPTPSQTIGPFFGFAMPFAEDGHAVAPADPAAIRVEGSVVDGVGSPVPDALVEVWAEGQFARRRTDPEGAFDVVVRKPVGEDGAPRLEVFVFARGLLRHLWTRLYFPDEGSANAVDPLLDCVEERRRSTLIAAEDGGALRFDIRLQGDGETVFLQLPDSA